MSPILIGAALLSIDPTGTAGLVLGAETVSAPSVAASPKPNVSPSPTTSPSPTPRAPAKPAPQVLGARTATQSQQAFGIAGNLASLSDAALGARLDGLQSLGVRWVRYDIEWSNIEAQSGVFNWVDYDRVVRAVSARGLVSLGIIDYTPAWARRSDCADSKMCAPADPAAYGQFAAAVAARYRPYGVHNWEIWNEPNNLNFFLPNASPAIYTSMLQAAYTQIKHVDSGAWVVTGGTAPEDSGGGYMSPPDFVRGLYASGAKGYFDALGHHPYTWPYSPAWPNPNGAWGQLSSLRQVMMANGDAGKKIWITEYGAPTGGPGGIANSGFSTAEGHADHVTEALQSRILTDAVNLEMQASWIGPFFWYSYQDAGTTNDTVENFFGLVRADGSRKPAFYIYQNLIATH